MWNRAHPHGAVEDQPMQKHLLRTVVGVAEQVPTQSSEFHVHTFSVQPSAVDKAPRGGCRQHTADPDGSSLTSGRPEPAQERLCHSLLAEESKYGKYPAVIAVAGRAGRAS